MDWLLLLMPLTSCAFALLFWTPLIALVGMYYAGMWWSAAILALYIPLYIDPVQSDPKRSRRTSLIIESPLWRSCVRWFNMRMVRSSKKKIDATRRRIFLVIPHGISPYSFGGLGSNLLGFKEIFPDLKRFPRLAMASVMFRIPLLRDLFLSYGSIDASRRTLVKAFEAGEDVILVPGGSQEVLLMRPGDDVAYLERRKGFCKLALEQGVDLVPTYTFGAVDAFDQVQWPPFRRTMSWIVSKAQFVIPVYWGYYGSPVPYRVDQTLVVGEPIHVDRVEKPTAEQVAELHRRFVDAVRDLFDKHKAECGFPDRTLRVV